jgi:hypothetical protein
VKHFLIDCGVCDRFEFDRVFDPMSTQPAVFESVQPLVVSVLDGYNVCIFGKSKARCRSISVNFRCLIIMYVVCLDAQRMARRVAGRCVYRTTLQAVHSNL